MKFSTGDYVKVQYTDWVGVIIEERGPLGPKGVFVYRLALGEERCVEVCEDQLSLTTPPSKEELYSDRLKELFSLAGLELSLTTLKEWALSKGHRVIATEVKT